MKQWYEVRNAATNEAEILIYDDIGLFGIGAEQFVREISDITAPVINIRINSDGGDAFDGFAIYNAIKRHPSRIVTHIDGLAASAASFVAIAADEVRIAKNAMVMIHAPMLTVAFGNADELRESADFLDKVRDQIAGIYVDRTGKTLDEVRAWMGDETWFTAEECVAAGFADVIADQEVDPERVANHRRSAVLNKARGHVPAANRLKALGLEDVIKTWPVNAATTETPMITPEQFQEFAAKNPDAVKTAAKDIIESEREAAKTEALNSAKPKNATAAELKAAFADDTHFVIDRLDVDAPLSEHKIAYADRLKVQNKSLRDELGGLRGELAKHDPATAGRQQPLNTGNPGGSGEQAVTPERKNEIRRMAGLAPK